MRRPAPKRVQRATLAAGPGADGELSALAATDLVWSALEQSLEFAPVLPVWIFDASPSARAAVLQVSSRLQTLYANRASAEGQVPEDEAFTLATSVIEAGRDIRFLLDVPTEDLQQVRNVLGALKPDSSGQERLFTAVGEALERLLPVRTEREAKLMLILVTDEAGDDAERIDELVEAVQREAVTVFVIGAPAPLGRVSATPEAERAESPPPSSDWVPVRQGPETRMPEHVAFESLEEGAAYNLLDSGFGPFALEWLCRASGGTFLALRPKAESPTVGLMGTQWPSPFVRRFPREVLVAYTPDYLSEKNYQQLLASNAALRALHEAAQRGPVTLLSASQREFPRTDEAQLSAALNKAQQEPAKLAPAINAVYDALKQGEAERDKILSRRGQAAYDLALGRAAVGKVRVEGYNAMLAKLKRGMAFQNASSTVWVLGPAETLGDSSLERIAEQARRRLEAVVRDHPSTPWAALAEHELAQPWGWAWSER